VNFYEDDFSIVTSHILWR